MAYNTEDEIEHDFDESANLRTCSISSREISGLKPNITTWRIVMLPILIQMCNPVVVGLPTLTVMDDVACILAG